MTQTASQSVSIGLSKQCWLAVVNTLGRYSEIQGSPQWAEWINRTNLFIRNCVQNSPSDIVSVSFDTQGWTVIVNALQTVSKNSNNEWRQWANSLTEKINQEISNRGSRSLSDTAEIHSNSGMTRNLNAEDKSEGYLRQSHAKVSEGKYEEALIDCNKAIAINPYGAPGYWMRGTLLLQLEKYLEASADFTYAIKLSPNDGEFYFWRGITYFNPQSPLRDLRKAMTDFDNAIRLNYNQPYVYQYRAMIYGEQQNIDKVISNLTKAIELSSDPYEKAQFEEQLKDVKQIKSDVRTEQVEDILHRIGRALWAFTTEFIKQFFKVIIETLKYIVR